MNLIILIWFCLLFDTQPNFPPPPGTIKISSNLFIDERPVTYLEYYEFRHFIWTNQPELLNDITPADTTISYKKEILWNNPKFYDFPILGLNIQQISMYCNWRSMAVNKLIEQPNLRCGNYKYWLKFDKLDPNKKYNVIYSLPLSNKIENYCKITKSHDFDEILIDGICSAQKGDKVKALNSSNWFVFRCMAEYQLKK